MKFYRVPLAWHSDGAERRESRPLPLGYALLLAAAVSLLLWALIIWGLVALFT